MIWKGVPMILFCTTSFCPREISLILHYEDQLVITGLGCNWCYQNVVEHMRTECGQNAGTNVAYGYRHYLQEGDDSRSQVSCGFQILFEAPSLPHEHLKRGFCLFI